MSLPESDPLAEYKNQVIPDEAILSRFNDAMAPSSNHASLQAQQLSHYAALKIQKFWRCGHLEDLAEAVEKGSHAVTNRTGGYAKYADRLDLLGVILTTRYERFASINDLETAIQLSRWAVKLTPTNHPDLSTRLYNLGNKLRSRFERIRRIEDLEEAIQVTRRAVEVTPPDSPDQAFYLNNVGLLLQRRFDRTRRIQDQEEAIQVARRSIEVALPDHPDLAAWLNTLGTILLSQFERIGRIQDQEDAIQAARRAVEVTPHDHPDLALYLNNLGTTLQSRFKRTSRMEDQEEAIHLAQRAVDITPRDHADLVARLNNLGVQLLLSQPSADDEALKRFLQAWNCANGIPFHRLAAAVNVIPLLKQRAQWDVGAQVATDVAHLLPLVNNRSLSRDDQRHVVSQFSGIASNVGALVLQNRGDAFTALELVELTRGSIIRLLMDDRSDQSTLRLSHPELAAEYERLRTEVNTPVHETDDPHLPRFGNTRRLEAVRELDQCIHQIREVPSYQRFLLGPSREELQARASDGPIVVININDIRSDAIIVTQSGIQSISLADLTLAETTAWLQEELTLRKQQDTPVDHGKKNAKYTQFLRWLWEKCVRQVLQAIYPSGKSAPGHLPRIWWIGVGIASSLPFHAAGDHSVDSTDNTLSWAISSYTPTIKALAHARGRQSTLWRDRRDRTTKSHLLMVSMPTTPGERNLSGVTQEISVIQTATSAAFSHQVLEHPDARSVLKSITHCDMVHFACHGILDTQDPFNSCLVLQRGPSDTATADPLSVRQVSETNLGRASIAYLSACSTAENRATRMMDEVIHLASGFQVAGFGHVVAAMWLSVDEVCVEMAREFYTQLLGGLGRGETDRQVAEAVHEATLQIRLRWRRYPLRWAPYVHVGA